MGPPAGRIDRRLGAIMGDVSTLERHLLIDWYQRNRVRSKMLFDMVAEEAYYSRPIDLRHPIVFYEGHLPAFSFNTLVKRGLGRPSIDAGLEALFARGIDPHEASGHDPTSAADRRNGWPDRDVVQRFAEEADRHVLDALAHATLEEAGHPLLDRAEGGFAVLQHEAVQQETLLYMWHRLPLDEKRGPAGAVTPTDGPVPQQAWIHVPAGRATLGLDRESLTFSWDNERPAT